jgi:hypothetical protein
MVAATERMTSERPTRATSSPSPSSPERRAIQASGSVPRSDSSAIAPALAPPSATVRTASPRRISSPSATAVGPRSGCRLSDVPLRLPRSVTSQRRSSGNDIVLHDPLVSRRHTELRRDGRPTVITPCSKR